ncbi:MAG TPA: sigma-70 family RNA polymerase sigma factor [Thermoanaerobaculia bacterium]|nr:sigma-70 family RNA polymerase sigma factor [Thermoanaerobaculia bacterium]
MSATVHASERDWPGDERALSRFLAGDVLGFEQIVRHYSGMVFSLAARLVGPAEAEDVVQETFLRAWHSLSRFRGESSLKTWLYAIALNRARARHGTLSRLKAVFTPGKTRDDEVFASLDGAADPALSPEENAVVTERRRRLREAIRALSDEFRTAVVLRDLEGLSYEEVAEVLGIPVGTVRSRLARGRALLKEKLS